MPFQSPYRGEEDFPVKLPPRAREWVSRGAMIVVGLVMAYFSVRGLHGMVTLATAAATQPYDQSNPDSGRIVGSALLMLVGLGLLGGLTIAAALVPVSAMETLLERWNSAPITGDRSPETDDDYTPLGRTNDDDD